MINYSIVIPHHNTPELLRRCLQSIPQREDIEVIVTDDTEGRGAGWARNQALTKAQGTWLIFADADDYFLPGAFEAFDAQLDTTADLVYFYAESCYSDTGLPANRCEHLTKLLDTYLAHPTLHNERLLRFNYHEPWGKMVRRSMVEAQHITFEDVRWANDVRFSTETGYYAKQIAVCKAAVYCITVAHGSLVHQRSIDSRRCRYEVMLRVNLWLREHGMTAYEHSLMYSLRRAYHLGGLRTLLEFIRIGRQHRAHFLTGWSRWLSHIGSLYTEDRGKEKYLVRS